VSTWREERRPAAEVEPRKIGEYLDETTRGMGVPKAGILAVVFSKWSELVGQEIASHAEPRALRDGVLTVVVDQPAWAAQLGYLAADLVAKIAVFTGSSEVEKVEFRVAAGGISGSREKSSGRAARGPD
jgi:predicted nucleic acid-binding Zn ribbon protein